MRVAESLKTLHGIGVNITSSNKFKAWESPENKFMQEWKSLATHIQGAKRRAYMKKSKRNGG